MHYSNSNFVAMCVVQKPVNHRGKPGGERKLAGLFFEYSGRHRRLAPYRSQSDADMGSILLAWTAVLA